MPDATTIDIPRSLRHIGENEPGIYRKRRGRGFTYLDEEGNKVTEDKMLKRIDALVIPPNWQDVWICINPKGHIQATGKDEAGRKQYIYHPKWNEYRNAHKFHRIVEFGNALPKLRRRAGKDLKLEGWPKEKVLALVVELLDEYYIRIGNEAYRERNETYGLTTLRRKHLHVTDDSISFQYKAKSGKYREIKVADNKLNELVREVSELPGYELFRYEISSRKTAHVDSDDVNEYIRSIIGEQFSSKDFRTWGGSVLAVEAYKKAKKVCEENPKKSLVPTIVKEVSETLGNTPSICREYYIHPGIIDAFEQGILLEKEEELGKDLNKWPSGLHKYEKLTLKIISEFEEGMK